MNFSKELILGILIMNSLLFAKNFSGNVRKEKLKNGVMLIHKYSSEMPIVSSLIFLKLGSIYETKKLSGISHLLQTVIIKGTKNRTAEKISEEIESVGGTIDSSSGYDFSTLSCVVSKQHFATSMELLSDVFYNPIFPEEEIEKEKNNTIASIISRKDSIFDVASDCMMENLYGAQHPYGWLEEGSIESVRKIKRNDLINFWKRFYGLDEKNNNLIFVVCGDIEFEVAKDMIEKYFPSFRNIKLPEIEYQIKSNFGLISKKEKFQQGYLMYGFLASELNSKTLKEYLSLKILSNYLGGGMSGKLFLELREKNSLCYETSCIYPTRLLPAYFVIYLGLDSNRMSIAKEEIEKIISQLKNNVISKQEVEDIKLKIKGRYLLDHQTTLRQGWYLGFWEIMGLGYEFDGKYLDEIYKITSKDVNDTASKIFSQDRVVVEIIPKK